MGPPDIAITFAATEPAVRRALNTVRSGLKYLSLSAQSMGALELVLAEVANNVVEHAYANSGHGVIGLTCRARDGLLHFEVTDSGAAMPGLTLPAKRTHDLGANLDDLPEGGFGWGLIRDLTASLAYRRVSGRNLLRFSIMTECAA